MGTGQIAGLVSLHASKRITNEEIRVGEIYTEEEIYRLQSTGGRINKIGNGALRTFF